jgi:hypothetical protein
MSQSIPSVAPLLLTLLLSLFPAVLVNGHGCPVYNISDSVTRAGVLALEDKVFPADLKDIINAYDDNATILTGVYDCHMSEGENEVGMAAVCEPDGGDCTCVAMYNFQPCSRCDLYECLPDDDDLTALTNLTIISFAADCSNVMGGLTEKCTVGCGFVTSGCLSSESSTVVSGGNETTTTGGGDNNTTDPMTMTPPPPKGGGGDDKNATTGTSSPPSTSSPTTTPKGAPPKGGTSPTGTSPTMPTAPVMTIPKASTAAASAAVATTPRPHVMMAGGVVLLGLFALGM